MPEVFLTEWQTFVRAHPELHLLQTGEWGELKSAFGWSTARIINGDFGVQILFRKLPLGLTLAYIPKAKFDSSLQDEVDEICKRHHAIFCKLEPDSWNTDHWQLDTGHWLSSPHNIQPPRTIVIDLHDKEEEILAHMKQKTRYNVRLAEKKGVTVRVWGDIPAFHKMMLITGGRDGFGVHSLEYYQRAYDLFKPTGMCELLLAEYEGRPLAALMVFAHGKRAWYVYGASNDDERNRMPTYLLQWEAIRWAKLRGCEEYDLWGVPDETEEILEAGFEARHDGLWGVYRFKRGFGGELKRAPQAMDRVYNPLLYKLYLWRMAGREIG
ncbi:MAG TPA: peptidoglycan bridge formation glycyltransferase FemA/FemB family protein [Anaerolineales bacterium]|nr:peptidoglycan bridge formation glycyltransferase FemA/FemB family protein [Anaerolineales bacterium]